MRAPSRFGQRDGGKGEKGEKPCLEVLLTYLALKLQQLLSKVISVY